MKILFMTWMGLALSLLAVAQNQKAIDLKSICTVELEKQGLALEVPCDAKKETTPDGKTIYRNEYFLDGAMAGYVYITISPNNYKTMDDIERVRGEMLTSYREQAEEFGLVTTLSEVSRSRASSHMHLHLAARSFPSLEGNAQFKYLFWNDLLLGKDYTVMYEMLAPYNELVVHRLREMVLKMEWFPVPFKDTPSGLRMLIPGGDWKASGNSTGIQLKPHYLWDNMYNNPKDKYPELQITPMASYSTMGFDKAVAEIKSKMQQRGGVIAEEENITMQNATKAYFVSAQSNTDGEYYDKEYVWLLQLPGNKFVECRMKAACDKYGCRGAYDVLPMFERVVESIKY